MFNRGLLFAYALFGTHFLVALGHIALIYPPARNFDLDFLDNGRTPAPCGMPKGSIRTSLIKGSRVNITWHLGYPHQGGYYLQLLDSNEEHLTFLTGDRIVANDTTAQHYALDLPKDMECRNCTLRLVRKALEWGKNYRFWSCADVDIVPRSEFKRDCSGNGRFFANRCLCNKRFFGTECQYENECKDDDDCGSRFGKCVDLDATSYPKKQCFCSRGYFGEKCSKSSHIKSETQVNLGVYTRRNLSEALTMYWRVLRNEGELEVVLVNKGTSYAAVGWRPADTTTSCRSFPDLTSFPAPKRFSSPEPLDAPEKEPQIKGEPDPKPEVEGEPEPELEAGGKQEPEHEAEGEPEPELEGSEKEAKTNPEILFSLPSKKTTTTEKDQSLATTNGPVLSLAERLANFGRKKRSTQSENPKIAAPLLKPAKSVVVKESVSQGSETEPEHEPVTEAEPEAEPEVETTTTTTTTNKTEPEPEPHAEGEPEPTPTAEGGPEPEAEGEPEPEPEPDSKSSSVSPYNPRGANLHAMDCTDIVVGMAQGSFYRVFDYYTRDRSTPRRDEFWGGQDSLTAVFGWERDGETTMLFRKKLSASHPTDYSITDSLMHVIWARGQEQNNYIHFPKSGLEVGYSSQPKFYREDELKYHGRNDQRGVTTINFYDSDSNLSQAGGGEKINWCGGQWKYPHSCSPDEANCEYYARWEFTEETDDIHFTVSSSNSNLWTGIGFSDNTNMRNTDVVLGWMTPAGKYFMYDGWLRSYTPPIVDSNQGISNMSATQLNGITTLNFVRKRNSTDKQDLSFTDSQCLYLVFPVKGGTVNFVNKRISKHHLTPTVSSERICIRSCSKFGGADGKPIVFTTTPKPPELKYNVEFKITNTGENLVIPEPGTLEHSTLVNQILTSAEGVFQKIPGYVVADVGYLDGSEPSAVKVQTQVTVNKEMYEQKFGKIKSREDQEEANGRIYEIVNESVKSGRIGQLSVEPSFLTVNHLEAKSLNDVRTVEKSNDVQSASALAFIDQHKYWFIGAAIVSLVVLALIQAIITSCRKKTNKPPPVSSKERLITNSRWKDYSRGATNYAYETYEAEEEMDPRRGPSIQRDSESFYKNGSKVAKETPHRYTNGRTSPLDDIPGERYKEFKTPSMGNYDHSRSLQRSSRYTPSSVISDPRTTYSLPRGASSTSSPPPYNMAMQELTPDFYYLPSQRKYSGEVVRVYVDYNQAK